MVLTEEEQTRRMEAHTAAAQGFLKNSIVTPLPPPPLLLKHRLFLFLNPFSNPDEIVA